MSCGRVCRGWAGAVVAGLMVAMPAALALAALVLAPTSALAADRPVFGPVPAWVKPAELPPPPVLAPGAPEDASAVRVLLTDSQHRVTGDGALESYNETAFRIGSPQGLNALGSLAFTWDPELETVTVHKMQLVRGGQVIDLLAGGKALTVLRREANLDRAMLDGRLTGALTPEGLQVGDIVDLAITRRHLDPALMGRVQTVTGAPLTSPVDRMRIRVVWPKDLARRGRRIQWRGGLGLPPIRTISNPDSDELVIEASNLEPVQRPRGAPLRYALIGALDITDFNDWNEVSALAAPLWAKAATLKPDSPLKAEAARIMAAYATPKLRAQAALKLVQEQVRYLFLGMNDGGYVPADAEATWQRRFGDCKGKTVLLMALLREMGIQAEPAVVNSALGDGLDARAPMLAVFDHVIVRAVIDAKVYWLDGTRLGDVNLDRLEVPPFKWALPIRPGGSPLEKLVPEPLAAPEAEFTLRIDASAGIDVPAPAHGEVILRGDQAYRAKVLYDNLQPAQLQQALKAYWAKRHDFIEVQRTGFSYDEVKGEARWTMDGAARMDWSRRGSLRRYEADDAGLGWDPQYAREPGPFADAPYAVDYPTWTRTEETIVLPGGGAGFSVAGLAVDQTLAGYALKRTAAITGGVFKMETSVRAVAEEAPAAQARAQEGQIKALARTGVFINAPAGAGPAPSGVAQGQSPVEPSAEVMVLLQRGAELHDKGDLDGAFNAYDAAVKLDPASGLALAARGALQLQRGRIAAAEADFQAALRLDPNQVLALNGMARIYLSRNDLRAVIAATDKALAVDPADAFAAATRAAAEIQLRRLAEAEADLARALASEPGMPLALVERAALRLIQGRPDEAIADADAVIKAAPEITLAYTVRAGALEQKKDYRGAAASLDEAIARQPGEGYLRRERGRLHAQLGETEAARSDLIAALELDPRDVSAYRLLAMVLLNTGDAAGALVQIDKGLQVSPAAWDLQGARGDILRRLGRNDEAMRAYDASIAARPNPGAYLARAALRWARDKQAAQADIAQARALDPKSRAPLVLLVQLRLRDGDGPGALAALDELNDAGADTLRAEALAMSGRYDEGLKLLDRTVAAKPNDSSALNNRCWYRATHGRDLELALADCNAAVRLAAGASARAQALDSRALVNLRLGRWPAALADYQVASRSLSSAAVTLYGRGLAKLRTGDAKGGAADLAAARTLDDAIEPQFTRWGLRP
jgi:tetratricopeptide (TPR) repeat protein